MFAALVGALFLGVLLLVVVWGYEPIAGAVVVSALPVGSLAVRPLAARLRTDVAGAVGALLLAAGLAGLALLPGVSGWLAALAFAFCGAGMGLALAVLGPATLPEGAGLPGAASRSVAARHAGLVLGLLLIAPLLAGNLEAKAKRRLAGRHGLRARSAAPLAAEGAAGVGAAQRDRAHARRRGPGPRRRVRGPGGGPGRGRRRGPRRPGRHDRGHPHACLPVVVPRGRAARPRRHRAAAGRRGPGAPAPARPPPAGSGRPSSPARSWPQGWCSSAPSGPAARRSSGGTRRPTPARLHRTPIRARASTRPCSGSRSVVSTVRPASSGTSRGGAGPVARPEAAAWATSPGTGRPPSRP